jgi:hypothetical protein
MGMAADRRMGFAAFNPSCAPVVCGTLFVARFATKVTQAQH